MKRVWRAEKQPLPFAIHSALLLFDAFIAFRLHADLRFFPLRASLLPAGTQRRKIGEKISFEDKRQATFATRNPDLERATICVIALHNL